MRWDFLLQCTSTRVVGLDSLDSHLDTMSKNVLARINIFLIANFINKAATESWS